MTSSLDSEEAPGVVGEGLARGAAVARPFVLGQVRWVEGPRAADAGPVRGCDAGLDRGEALRGDFGGHETPGREGDVERGAGEAISRERVVVARVPRSFRCVRFVREGASGPGAVNGPRVPAEEVARLEVNDDVTVGLEDQVKGLTSAIGPNPFTFFLVLLVLVTVVPYFLPDDNFLVKTGK